MEHPNSNFSDKIMAILFVFALPVILLIIGVITEKLYIIGIPFIIYGLYGLISKKVWLPTFGESYTNKEFYFRFNKDALPVSLAYIFLGLFLGIIVVIVS